MKYTILIFFLVFPYLIFSQVILKGVICDSKKNALPYTNIVTQKKRIGTSTNEKGEFELINVLADDSIKISNIAFHPKLVSPDFLHFNDTIFLDDNIKDLEEIIVKNFGSFKYEQNLGFIDLGNNAEFKLMPGSQMAVFIANKEKKEGWIKDISFKVKKSGFCKNKIRVRLLKLDSMGINPSIDLLKENVILNANELKRTNHVDISEYKLLLPTEGVFVVLEWVASDINCEKKSFTSITANMAISTNLVWLNFRDKLWSHNNSPRLPNGNYMTPNINIKVAY